jgi:hypothetical protein
MGIRKVSQTGMKGIPGRGRIIGQREAGKVNFMPCN